MKKYNIALIGCGHMGTAHLDDIYFKPNINVSCVCDTDITRAEKFKYRYNADRIETDYKKLIASDDVDIIIAAAVPSLYLDILKLCIKYNKHLLCEKPIAPNLDQANEFAALVKQNPQIKVLIGHILRHNETYCKAAEMIRSGAIGFPIVMRMVQNHHTMDWQKYLNLIKQTSPIIDCGVHYLDVCRWFTGAEICEISGIGLKTEADVPDGKYNYGMITYKLTDGSVGFYEAGWSNTIAASNIKEFSGPKGRITITYRKDRYNHQEEGDMIEYYRYPEKTYEIININCLRKPTGKQLDYLINMIENDVPANPSIDDVLISFTAAVKADEIIRSKL